MALFVGYCISLHKQKYLILYIVVNMGFTDLVVVAYVFSLGVGDEGHKIFGVFYRLLWSKSLTCCLISE